MTDRVHFDNLERFAVGGADSLSGLGAALFLDFGSSLTGFPASLKSSFLIGLTGD